MPGSKARLARRFIVRIPFRFRLLETAAFPEQAADSMNVSRNGLYFATDVSLRPAQVIVLRLKMPELVTGRPEAPWRITCRVAHVERAQSPGRKFGVGVHFLYYEVAGAEAAAARSEASDGAAGKFL